MRILPLLQILLLIISSTFLNRNPEDKIYSKVLKEGLKIDFYRSESDSTFIWELHVSTNQKQSDIKFIINKDDLRKSHLLANRASFYELFNITDAFFDYTDKSLLVLMDQFGQIDLYKFPLRDDYTFNTQNVKPDIKHFKTYKVIPRDLQLLREDIQDVKLYRERLYSVSCLTYGHYGSYFFNTLDFDKDIREEFVVSMSEVKDKTLGIKEEKISAIATVNLNDSRLVTSILEEVKEKSIYKGKNLSYKFYLETREAKNSYEQKKTRNGLLFFFAEIENIPEIMIYDGSENWYIVDYKPSKETKDTTADFTVQNIHSIIQIRY